MANKAVALLLLLTIVLEAIDAQGILDCDLLNANGLLFSKMPSSTIQAINYISPVIESHAIKRALLDEFIHYFYLHSVAWFNPLHSH